MTAAPMTGQTSAAVARSDGLTAKQAKFVAEYLKTGNASEAYRLAYNASGMNADSVNREAHALMAHPKISPRIALAFKRVQQKAEITLESLTQDLLDDRDAARADKNHPAAIAATKALMELHGLKTGERKNERDPFEELSPEERRARIDKLLPEAGYTLQ
jgi:phage terminase small subunit